MTKKYFFFDIDGTLTTQNPGGDILPSTMSTIQKLKENGHFVAIATGRSFHDAKEYCDLLNIDHIVHDGGFGVTINRQLLGIESLNKEKAVMICLECLEKNIPFCVVLDDSKNCFSHHDAFIKGREQYASFFNLKVIKDLDYRKIDHYYKIYIGLEKGKESQLKTLSLLGYSRYFDNHLNIEPDDKAVGIQKVMKYYNASIEDVVVFGDGHNDLTMFQFASTSIAMGNAIDELKEIATFVTKRSDEDGIEYACKYFGWI